MPESLDEDAVQTNGHGDDPGETQKTESVVPDDDGTVEMDRERLLERIRADQPPDEDARSTLRLKSPFASDAEAETDAETDAEYDHNSNTEKMAALELTTRSYHVPDRVAETAADGDDPMFQTLDVPLEAVEQAIEDENVARTESYSHFADPTTEQFRKNIVARFEFKAIVDENGHVKIPERFLRHSLVEPGMKVAVTVAEDRDSDE